MNQVILFLRNSNNTASFCFVQTLKDELHDYENKMAELEGKLQTVTEKYNSPETAALAKDLAVLRKKLNAAEQKTTEVSFLLLSTSCYHWLICCVQTEICDFVKKKKQVLAHAFYP